MLFDMLKAKKGLPVNDLFLCAMKTKKGGLPKGYTQLAYIESSSGGAYINTGLVLESGFKVSIDFEVPTSTANLSFWGYRWSGSFSDPYQCYIMSNSGNRRIVVGTTSGGTGNNAAFLFDHRTLIIIDAENQLVTVDGEEVTLNKDFANVLNGSGSSVYAPTLFTFNVVGTPSAGCAMKLYGYKVEHNGEILQNMIPAKNAEDVCGMYDLISNQFFDSETSTPFTGE